MGDRRWYILNRQLHKPSTVWSEYCRLCRRSAKPEAIDVVIILPVQLNPLDRNSETVGSIVELIVGLLLEKLGLSHFGSIVLLVNLVMGRTCRETGYVCREALQGTAVLSLMTLSKFKEIRGPLV